MRRLRSRRWLAAGLALVVAVALGAAWAFGLLFTDTARPAAAGSVLGSFRAGDPHPRALDGIYAYRTSGGESLDVLGGKRHHYPATTTITVVTVPCGLRLRWDALAGRSTTWTLCTRSGGVDLRGLDEFHTFFGQTDRTRYVCGPAVDGRFHCRTRHGAEAGRQSVAGRVYVTIGGVRLQALRLHMTAAVSGASRGTETVDWWLDRRTALPLELAVSSRTSRAEPLIGRAHYREDATLRLVSTTPER